MKIQLDEFQMTKSYFTISLKKDDKTFIRGILSDEDFHYWYEDENFYTWIIEEPRKFFVKGGLYFDRRVEIQPYFGEIDKGIERLEGNEYTALLREKVLVSPDDAYKQDFIEKFNKEPELNNDYVPKEIVENAKRHIEEEDEKELYEYDDIIKDTIKSFLKDYDVTAIQFYEAVKQEYTEVQRTDKEFWLPPEKEFYILALESLGDFTELEVEEKKDKTELYKAYSLDEVIQQYNSLSYSYIINGMFEERHLVMIYGAPGVGKTYLVLNMLGAITTGEDFHKSIRCEEMKVLYLDGEDNDTLKRRLNFMASEGDINGDNVRVIYDVPPLGHKDSVALFKQRLLELKEEFPFNVIMIDSLSQMTLGKNLNDSTEMRPIGETLRKLTNELDTAIVFIHHSSKSDPSNFNGSMYIESVVNSSYYLVKDDDKISMIQKKARGGLFNKGKPISFRFHEVNENVKLIPTTSGAVKYENFDNIMEDILQSLKDDETIKQTQLIAKIIEKEPNHNERTLRRKFEELRKNKNWMFYECIVDPNSKRGHEFYNNLPLKEEDDNNNGGKEEINLEDL